MQRMFKEGRGRVYSPDSVEVKQTGTERSLFCLFDIFHTGFHLTTPEKKSGHKGVLGIQSSEAQAQQPRAVYQGRLWS